MTSIHAQVVASDGQTTLIKSPAACRTCHACSVEKFKTATISGSFEGEVQLTLESKLQWQALLHSLLLPLLLALALAFVADMLLASEIFGIIAAVCGFSIGMRLCRQLNPEALQIKAIDRG